MRDTRDAAASGRRSASSHASSASQETSSLASFQSPIVFFPVLTPSFAFAPRHQKNKNTIVLMSTPAQLQLVRDVLESVAGLCEELAADFPHLAAAAAHYFRHGAPGRVPAPLDEAQLDAFATAVENKLKQKKRGMGILLEANVVDLLVEGEAFYVGDPLAPADNDALADVPLAAPVIPMSLLVSARRSAKRYTQAK